MNVWHGYLLIIFIAAAIGGCASIDRFLETPEEAARRIERERIQEITDGLAETCEVSPEAMSAFVVEIHGRATGNRVTESLLVTARSLRDASRAALRIQKQYDFKRRATETCEQVANDYAFKRLRDWHLRGRTPRQTVQSVLELITSECKGYWIRRIY